MTLKQYKAKFRAEHPNLRVNGWDERDYLLWGDVQQLPSYALLTNGDTAVSRKQVVGLIKKAAEARFDAEWKARFGPKTKGIVSR